MRPTVQMILRTLLCLALLASNPLNASIVFRSGSGMNPERALYLNPTTGRFWTMDTYEGSQSDPLTLHKYVYVVCNPVNLTDPSGHEGIFEAINMVQSFKSLVGTINVATKWLGLLNQQVTIHIVTEIRPPDAQAGVKTVQIVVVTGAGRIMKSTTYTGTTSLGIATVTGGSIFDQKVQGRQLIA